MNLSFTIIITILLGCLTAEIVGYFLHRLLHSNKVKFLSRGHMIHHLKLYGPKDCQALDRYESSVVNRTSIAGFGSEWFVPVFIIIGLILGIGLLLQISLLLIVVFSGSIIAYTSFFFSYMHDKLHIQGFWMGKNRFLKKWFFRARKLHILHHKVLNDEGKMNTNYGICFFFYDRVFGTKITEARKFNENGFQAAMKRYKYIFED